MWCLILNIKYIYEYIVVIEIMIVDIYIKMYIIGFIIFGLIRLF